MALDYAEFRRDLVSRCNLCRRRRRLTWDHVPPKGSISVTPVEQESVFRRIVGGPDHRHYRISQNGVKFQTLCGECNSFLGSRYDLVLSEFSQRLGELLKSDVQLPSVVQIRTQPTALMRGLLGHLLAAKVHIDHTVPDDLFRRFVCNEDALLPESVKVFYWVFPYPHVIIVRDVAMRAVRGRSGPWAFFNILKYFPLAYLITDLDAYEGLQELTVFRGLASDESAEVPIDLESMRHADWPEVTDPGNPIMGGTGFASSVYSAPRAGAS